jgi:hypothetical protein
MQSEVYMHHCITPQHMSCISQISENVREYYETRVLRMAEYVKCFRPRSPKFLRENPNHERDLFNLKFLTIVQSAVGIMTHEEICSWWDNCCSNCATGTKQLQLMTLNTQHLARYWKCWLLWIHFYKFTLYALWVI